MTEPDRAIDPVPSEAVADERLRSLVEALQVKKGLDILLMDLHELSDVADYFLLATGTSDLHVKSLAQEVLDRLKESDERPWHVEGVEHRRWVLIDLVDVVIHLFRPEAREFYALERLWGDAQCTSFEDSWEPAPSPTPTFEE